MLKLPKIEMNQNQSVYSGLAILVIVSLSLSGFFIYRFNAAKNDLNVGQQASEKEVQDLIKQVGKIYELPKGETPNVATVTDPNRLRNQPFFANAQIGDKVIVFINARKGVLYRPKTNQIINVSPININNQTTTPSQSKNSAPTTEPIRITLYNGTQKSGLANQFEQSLKQKLKDVQFTVVGKSNAKKTDYKLTKVIDLKGKFAEEVVQIASAIDAENSKLPTSENSPSTETDILIIIGDDYSTPPAPSSTLPTSSE